MWYGAADGGSGCVMNHGRCCAAATAADALAAPPVLIGGLRSLPPAAPIPPPPPPPPHLQGRPLEHLAHRKLNPQHLAQPQGQLHSQQRVASKLEEVILPAYPLNLEQFLPDLRPAVCSDSPCGSSYCPRDIRIPFRGRQCLAILPSRSV